MRKLTYEEVKKTFEERGCELLSTEYVSSSEKLIYICTCGNVAEIAYSKFKMGQLCMKCRGRRSNAHNKYTLEEVATIFADGGCRLLSDKYEGNRKKLKYECECGEHAEIALTKFMAGQRCRRCKYEKIGNKLRGENNPNYNHEKSREERLARRQYHAYNEWRSFVFERDDYTCQCCGQRGGKLVAHHINSYSQHPEFRLSKWNGVTLCYDCHMEYHKNFTWRDADEETFFEFMFGEYREPWYAGEVFDD